MAKKIATLLEHVAGVDKLSCCDDLGAPSDERLWASESREALHPAWHEEIARRVANMDAGRVRFMPADVAMAALATHIRRRLPVR